MAEGGVRASPDRPFIGSSGPKEGYASGCCLLEEVEPRFPGSSGMGWPVGPGLTGTEPAPLIMLAFCSSP